MAETEIKSINKKLLCDTTARENIDNLQTQINEINLKEVTVTVDSELSSTSENPIQNKAVSAAVDSLKGDLDDHKDDTTKHITSAERTKWNKNTTDIVALNEALANMQGTVVDSVEEMTDITKRYILKSTGTVWEYRSVTTEQEVTITDEIIATADNPYNDNARLGSSGDISTQSGYVVTPYIDLTKEELVLEYK